MLEAIVDLGYNSFQLCIYEHYESNAFKLLTRYKSFIRSGFGLTENGKIKDEKIKDALFELLKYKKIIDNLNINKIKAVGTSAFRMVSNGNEVSEQFSRIFGTEIKIISGYEEGNYSVTGSLNTLPFNDALVFDLGGSLEIALVKNRKIEKNKALQFRCIEAFKGIKKRKGYKIKDK